MKDIFKFRKVYSEEYLKAMSGGDPRALTRRQMDEIRAEALRRTWVRLDKNGIPLKEAYEAHGKLISEGSRGNPNSKRFLTPTTELQKLGKKLIQVKAEVAQKYNRDFDRERATNGNGNGSGEHLPILSQADFSGEVVTNGVEGDGAKNGGPINFRKEYVALVERSDFLPSDDFFEGFTGKTSGAPGSARQVLRKCGYVIKRAETPTELHYWVVIERPKPEEPPPPVAPPVPEGPKDGGPLSDGQLEQVVKIVTEQVTEMTGQVVKQIKDHINELFS